VVAGKTFTSSGSSNETTSYSAQLLRNTCTNVGNRVCDLLAEVYDRSFLSESEQQKQKNQSPKKHSLDANKQKKISFRINCTPLLEIGDIIEMHFRQFVDDTAVNEMLLASIGFPLNKTAERLPWCV
jgi:hypothetical protein